MLCYTKILKIKEEIVMKNGPDYGSVMRKKTGRIIGNNVYAL